MAALTQIMLPDGRTVKLEDWGELPMWAQALVLAVQAQDVYFFNYGRGEVNPSTAVQANDLNTNFDKGGQLLGGEMFIFGHTIEPNEVGLLGGEIPAWVEMDRLQFKESLARILVEFRVAGRIYAEGKIGWMPQGGGPYGFDTIAGPGAGAIFTNGFPTPQAIRRFTVPVHVASSQEKIEGKWRFVDGALAAEDAVDWTWTWKLEGLRRRLR